MKYIRLMGLESKLRDYSEDRGAHLWYLRGKRFITPTGPWPLEGLTAAERANPFGMIGAYWGAGFKAAEDPRSPGFPTDAALGLDRDTIVDYFKKQGASEAWVRVILASEGHVGRMNALAATMAEASIVNGPAVRMYGLAGGNDQLPKALAASLGDRVKYDSPVLRVSHGQDDVVITFRDRGGQQQVRADYCVCTLPFPVLRDVEITPAFSSDKMSAIRRYQLMPVSRLYFQTKTRFWRTDPLGPLGGLNMVGTDTPAERLWNTSLLQPDPTLGMLHSYMVDDNALAFAATPAGQRATNWTKTIATFLPDLEGQIAATYQGMAGRSLAEGRLRVHAAERVRVPLVRDPQARGTRALCGRAHVAVVGLAERRGRVRGARGRRDRRGPPYAMT